MLPASFLQRLLATLLDALWMLPLNWLLATAGVLLRGGRPLSAGGEVMLNVVFALIVLLFWATRQATPGKLALGLRVVDAAGGGAPPIGRLVARYVGYLVSAIPLGLGYLWMLWDPRRQTWHDKLAGTVVVRTGPSTGVFR